MAEQIEQACVVCKRREADYGWTCRSEPARLLVLLAEEIPELYAALTPDHDLGGPMVAGPVRAITDGPRVSGGSVEASAPIDLAVVDLTAPIRPLARQHQARAALGLDEDQGGDLSVATELGTWVRDWADRRGEVERNQLPRTTVLSMCLWLADRTDWACQYHEAIDEAAEDFRRIRSRLQGAVGVSDRPELIAGRCPKCSLRTLYRVSGDTYIHCGNAERCGALFTPEELHLTRGVAAA